MMHFLLFLGFLVVTVSGDLLVNLTDDKPTYTWNPSTSETLTILAEEGYQTEIVIQTLNLDGTKDEYLSIKDDDNTREIWFSYSLVTPSSYFYNTNKIMATYNGANISEYQLLVQFNRK
ncbi:hypothetical protein GWI33_009087, partial [Rhynchophorus ferrugineus]